MWFSEFYVKYLWNRKTYDGRVMPSANKSYEHHRVVADNF